MISVFDGGVGSCNGGIEERSSESGVRDLDEGLEECGDDSADILKSLLRDF